MTDDELIEKCRSLAYVGDAMAKAVLRVLAERDKLAAFKVYVHRRLDEAGVPADPESPHRAEGCRVGGRLDVVLAAFAPERDAA